ncbi:hypothetical protein CHUAL_003203 [Chamberlinius hualienensis]
MLPSPLPYDFLRDEAVTKWKNLLVDSLQKVQFQVHPALIAKEDALDYVETLILRLLGILCACQPHSALDVEERVTRMFPNPIDKWAIGDAQNAIEKGKKKSPLVLPVDKIHPLLQKEILGYKIDYQVSLYIVAVLEYISADILKLAGNYVKNIRHSEITCPDVKVAMNADKVLMDMFYPDDDVNLSIEEEPINRKSQTYDELVKDLIHEEKQYLRDLNMIIRVFREPFVNLLPKNKDLDILDSCIMDVYEFTVKLLVSLEDTIEMTEENESPTLGSRFEELAETAEFDVYERYAQELVRPLWKYKLLGLVHQSDLSLTLQSAGHNFVPAVKYVLPKLLLGPIYHCFQYFVNIKALLKLTPSEDDRESLEQAEGQLRPLQVSLERMCGSLVSKKRPGEMSLRLHRRMSRSAALQKMNELQKSIDGWEGRDIGQCCNEFIQEGILGKVSSAKRTTERCVFLFDGLLILCKQNNRRTSVTGPVGEYRLKEKYYIRKIDIVDREDTDELKNFFEIVPRDQPRAIFYCKNVDEKNNWMESLIMLTSRSMLERTLDSILMDDEKKHPLWLPSPDVYRFAVEDDETNIVFEDKEAAGGVPLIKGATLLKLVERLTYHMYADPMFVRTFLTTFRSFCQPQELLDLLIERFDITEPPSQNLSDDEIISIEHEEMWQSTVREDLKRFRKEYSQPVQFRVLNVLRHWVDHHFYDFERDPSLLVKLQSFLERIKGKSMKKWADSIAKIVQRRKESPEDSREIMFGYERSPPLIEWHLARTYDHFDLMTLHPIEIARQLTLLEFELYRAVKPSELVGAVWTKKNKEKTSPNLLAMIHHSTNITLWLMKSIVETENVDERAAVVSRILEIMIVLQELNNFTGVIEVVSAMNSASVYRLEHTFTRVSDKLIKALDDAKELNADHYKKYQEKLRSINPPCVPFLGMYLTNILHIEEGNPDFLPYYPEGIINFSKRRKVANITGEIQQYQNQPYCLSSHSEIRHFLENVHPLEDYNEKEFNDYLYSKSLEIEPRNCKQPPRFSRKMPDSYLKSPGIKLRNLPGRLHPGPLPSSEPNLLRSSTRISDDREVHSPRLSTPPTPSSPSYITTPPPNSLTATDNSVFAPVLIPGGNTSPGPIIASNSNQYAPPLPPRRRRESSTSDNSPRIYCPTVDELSEEIPPPLPPRRDHASGVTTLPRMHSISQLPGHSSFFDGTLPPRRNSVMDVPNSSGPPQVVPRRRGSHSVSTNGPTPQLPPRPCRQSCQFSYASNTAPR